MLDPRACPPRELTSDTSALCDSQRQTIVMVVRWFVLSCHFWSWVDLFGEQIELIDLNDV